MRITRFRTVCCGASFSRTEKTLWHPSMNQHMKYEANRCTWSDSAGKKPNILKCISFCGKNAISNGFVWTKFFTHRKNSLAPLKEPTYKIWSQSVHMERLCWKKTPIFWNIYLFMEKTRFRTVLFRARFSRTGKTIWHPSRNPHIKYEANRCTWSDSVGKKPDILKYISFYGKNAISNGFV